MIALLGGTGIALYAVVVAASLVGSLIDYAIAFFLVAFLCSLGFGDAAQLPSWWPFDVHAFSSLSTWGLLLAVAAVQALTQTVTYQAKIILTERVNARLKLVMAWVILKRRALHAMPASVVNFYMVECFPKATMYVFYLAQTTTLVVQTFVMVVGMVWLAPGEAIVGSAALGVLGGLALGLNRFTHRLARQVPAAAESLERTKLRVARNWLVIKVLRMEDAEHARLVDAVARYYRHSVLSYFFANLGGGLFPVIGVIAIAAIAVAHFRWFHTAPTELLAFLYLFVRLGQRLSNGANLIGGLFTSRPQLRASLDLLTSLDDEERHRALAPERDLGLGVRPASTAAAPGTAVTMGVPATTAAPDSTHGRVAAPPRIRVEAVTFRWPGADASALDGVSADVAAGAQFGIVGPNGSGKSTLLGVILGVYPPTAGRVTIDGVDAARWFGLHADAIAYVGPEPYLVHGTLRENLEYGLRRAPSAETLERVLRTVRLRELVETLPEGLAFTVQEDGTGLSSGERQRVAIARALLREPRLLVLDEPSANLDDVTEAAVRDTLQALKGRCTVLIVSHRPGVLRDVDATLDLGAPRGAPSVVASAS